jgi:hypothetical protein
VQNDLREVKKLRDLRCYSLHFFFQIEGAELYNGETGYASSSFEQCTKEMEKNSTVEGFNKVSEVYRKVVAEQLKVPIEQVIPISRECYEANTEEDYCEIDECDEDY